MQTGMAFALDTLCGQAFGARQYHLLGVYKQRAMLVIGVACAPFALVWANAGRILVFLRQDHAVAAEAGAYARWLIPSLALYVPLQCHVRFLQTQSLVLPVVASSGATALCHVAVCWALVHRAGRHGQQGRRAQQCCLVRAQPGDPRPVRQAVRRLRPDLERPLRGGVQGAASVRQSCRAVCVYDMVRRRRSLSQCITLSVNDVIFFGAAWSFGLLKSLFCCLVFCRILS